MLKQDYIIALSRCMDPQPVPCLLFAMQAWLLPCLPCCWGTRCVTTRFAMPGSSATLALCHDAWQGETHKLHSKLCMKAAHELRVGDCACLCRLRQCGTRASFWVS